MSLTKQLQSFGSVPFSHGALLSLLDGYKRPNDKISRLLAAGELVQLKKGLYILGEDARQAPVSLPLVANLLYGPSCVSLDFALGWHGLIPEGVMGISSITTRRAKHYSTPLGRFSYEHIPPSLYRVGVRTEPNPDGSHFLLASPEKALCDKILLTRNLKATSTATMRVFLEADLRIDLDDLAGLDIALVRQYMDTGYKSRQLMALCRVIEEAQ